MPDFRIAAAQVPSVRGDIDANIATHAATMSAAAKHAVSVLVFPELSLGRFVTKPNQLPDWDSNHVPSG